MYSIFLYTAQEPILWSLWLWYESIFMCSNILSHESVSWGLHTIFLHICAVIYYIMCDYLAKQVFL